jgi:hypothetical protein
LELLGKLNGELRISASAIGVANAHNVRTLSDFYADNVHEMTEAEIDERLALLRDK